ncbi:MAG: hypothetical protein PVF15_09475 [Candidatus Bathyarchaeota archaeon]|jgi:hypothetical protein
MPERPSQRLYLSFLVSVSLFGLFLVTLPTILPLTIEGYFQWRKPLIGSVFGIICFLGIIAVFFPSHCSTILQKENTESRNQTALKEEREGFRKTSKIFGLRLTHGHHQNCEGFSAHEFQVGNKTYCTACMGLLLGALVSVCGVVLYFFEGWNIGENISLFLISGVLGVGLGLFQYVSVNVRWRFIRFSLNVFFVFGTFLVLASVDAASGSLILDFFVVLLCVFWLLTRILLSKNIHNKICQTCDLRCEDYKN